ncbi:MAG: YciI family protein [Ktedonobacterales bacterium]
MRYTLLICVDQNLYEKLSPEEMQTLTADYNAFGERFKDKIKGGEALQPTPSATTVRVRESKTLTTDGPFAETKEQLGGYYLVTCDNLDEAIQMAAQIPDAVRGSIEVRPVMEFE